MLAVGVALELREHPRAEEAGLEVRARIALDQWPCCRVKREPRVEFLGHAIDRHEHVAGHLALRGRRARSRRQRRHERRRSGDRERAHRLSQGIADAQVRFGVPELVVAVAGVRRILGVAHERRGGHEACARRRSVAADLGARRGRGLRTPQRVPLVGRLYPRARQLADHHGKPRRIKLAPQVAHEVHQVLLVLGHGALWVAAVVPALVPDHARELGAAFGKRRDLAEGPVERRVHVGHRARVVRPDRSPRGRRPEVGEQALAAPRDLHEQHGFVDRIAEHVTDPDLRPEVVLVEVRREPEAERPRLRRLPLRRVAHEDIVAHDPRSVARAYRRHQLRGRRVLGERDQRAAAVVVVRTLEVDDPLTLHVGLADQDEDLARAGEDGQHGVEGKGASGNQRPRLWLRARERVNGPLRPTDPPSECTAPARVPGHDLNRA